MFRWALGFLMVAMIAALLGFGLIAGAASSIAIFLFWVFVGLFAVTVLASVVATKRFRAR